MVPTGQHTDHAADKALPVTPLDMPSWALPVLVAPPEHDIALLTGDTWAPTVCAALRAARRSILLAQYSISTAWPKHVSAMSNVLGALLEAPPQVPECIAVLAIHKASSASANFNRRAHSALESAGWLVRRPPASKLLHAKLYVIDYEHVILGSHNCSVANSATNTDLSVMMSGKATAAAFAAFVKNLTV